jgi:hypothetical protein
MPNINIKTTHEYLEDVLIIEGSKSFGKGSF